MNWVSFITGGVTVLMVYALFSNDQEENPEVEMDEHETDMVVNGPAGRHVTLSCQTCRKLKRHREVEPNLFQCTKCKRHVDLRKVS